MEQDDLEDQVFYQSLLSHLDIATRLIKSHPTISAFFRPEIVFVIVLLVFVQSGRWILKRTSNFEGMLGGGGAKSSVSWVDDEGKIFVRALQGKRPSMEDRFLSIEVKNPITDTRALRVNAVLDGHGGEFAVDYVRNDLIRELTRKLQALLLISSLKKNPEQSGQKLAVNLIESFQKKRLSKEMLDFIGLSQSEYSKISFIKEEARLNSTVNASSNEGAYNRLSSKPASTSEEPASFCSALKDTKSSSQRSKSPEAKKSIEKVQPLLPSRKSPVSTSRQKLIDEPRISISNGVDSTPSKLLENKTPQTFKRAKTNSIRTNDSTSKQLANQNVDLMTYISNDGRILYNGLLKDEIKKIDTELLDIAKRKCSYAGTTLLLTILDESNIWVANVGDSRGVLCDDLGNVLPLSYDHKPSQLKEKKRIEEAGGFVCMNGVWRVQGILATSRALGDYPLKDKNLVVSEPDVLSFSIREHKPRFFVLATDGLWDTHSNEETVAHISQSSQSFGGIKSGIESLCDDALSKGSLDNITVLVMTF